MDCSFDISTQGVQEWHETLSRLCNQLQSDSDVKKILQNVYQQTKIAKSFDKNYFQSVWTILEQLTNLKLDEQNAEVVNIISLMIEESDTQSIHFAKINLKIFRDNHNLLKSSKYLETFVRCLCSIILKVKEKSYDNKQYSNLMKCQLIVIVALQKLFPGIEFRGDKYLIKLFIGCHNNEIDNLNQHLENIFIQQFQTASASLFLKEIFSLNEAEKNEEYLNYCLLVFFKIIESNDLLNVALSSSSENSNFACNLIKTISDHLYLLETNADLFDNLTNAAVQLIIASLNMQHEIVEKFLIRGMLSNNLALSVVCFDLLCLVFTTIDSISVIQSYFILFQDIFINIWKGGNITQRRPMLMAQILRLLYRLHGDQLTPVIKLEVKNFLEDQKNETQINFSLALSKMQCTPTVENYQALVDSINAKTNIPEEMMKDYCNFVENMGNSNWNVHTSLIINIIDHIISITDLQRKMILLLKLNPKQKEMSQIPMIIKHNLIKLIASFTSKKESFENLRNYLESLLNILLNDDYSTRQYYKNITNLQTIDCHLKETTKLLKSSKNLSIAHKCHNKN